MTPSQSWLKYINISIENNFNNSCTEELFCDDHVISYTILFFFTLI